MTGAPVAPQCPLCGGREFGPYNSRPQAQCRACGSLERARLLWLFLQKEGLPRPDDRILHIAPEKCLAEKFLRSHGERYIAADINPDGYRRHALSVLPLDLCEKQSLKALGEFDFILHNHVLEHVACGVAGVLQRLAAQLKSGGTMVFTVPARSKMAVSTENLDPLMPAQERIAQFGQADHMRAFGRDFTLLVLQALGRNCFLPLATQFDRRTVESAGAIWRPAHEPNGNSIFCFRQA